MVDGIWQFGERPDYMVSNAMNGITSRGMPAFGEVLSYEQLEAIVDYILSKGVEVGAVKPPPPEHLQTIDYDMKVEVVTDKVEIPWGITFLDESTALITERAGRLRILKNDELQVEPIADIPKVLDEGQGGLLDVTAHPDYEENGWVYLAYSHESEEIVSFEDNAPSMTRIVRGRIRDDTWVDQQVVFQAERDHYIDTQHHYGSRIVFDAAGYLYFSVGDRGEMEMAQDITRPNGKIHRIWPDGSIPQDNPFNHIPGAVPSVFAYGNRNPQGLSVHPASSQLWETEHGPMGGDELNVITPGRNYGWPAATYGINYDGEPISAFTRKQGIEDPIKYWLPSTGVSGITFYEGDQFPGWNNALLVSSLKYQDLRLLKLSGNRVMHEETIFMNYGRVRDVGVSPNGAIYVLLSERDAMGKIVKLTALASRKYFGD
jgi:glucose/arabinose dehydrogenase